MRPKLLPPSEILRECFSYDPVSGILVWRERPSHHFKSHKFCKHFNAKFANKHAGSVISTKDGRKYLKIGLFRDTALLAHRIIYKLMTDKEPQVIDHKDRNGLNNSWNNLRSCTQYQNMQNSTKPRNKTGFKGVYKAKNKWCAEIESNGIRTRLGLFPTPEEAAAVYAAAALCLHGEFACID